MSDPFKPFPELVVDRIDEDDGELHVVTANTRQPVFSVHKYGSEADMRRFVECWNALRKIAFPTAHLDATEEYVKRLEKLRRDAVAATHEVAQ